MLGARTFLHDLALVFCVSAVVTVLFRRLGQPVVLGYLLAGIIIGPSVAIMPLFADVERIQALSELGVILVMFAVGLELSVARLVRVLPTAGVTGLIQIGGMMWLGYTVGALFGWRWQACLFTSAMVAVSSTLLVARTFAEQKIERRLADLVFGVLIIQDLAAVLLLAVLTAIAAGRGFSAGSLVDTTGRLAVFLIALLVIGFLVVPRAIRAISRLESPETLLVASVGLSFGLALLAQELGYSVALGAFLAGSLIAESGRQKQVKHLIEPLRDLFAAVFFVSVGMMVDPAVVLAEWRVVLAITAIVVLGNFGVVSLGSFLSGMGVHTSIRAGMSLTHIGELSFIIAGVGVASGVAGSVLYPVAVAVAVITAFCTPWLVRVSGPVALAVEHRLPRPLQTFVALYGNWFEALRARWAQGQRSKHVRRRVVMLVLDATVIVAIVVVVSVAWPGIRELLVQRLGVPEVLTSALIIAVVALVALPFAGGVLRRARKLGVALASAVLPPGDAGRVDLAAAPRRAFILTLQLGIILLVGIPILAATQPFLPLFYGAPILLTVIVVLGVGLWRSTANLEGHVHAGAELVLEVLGRQRGDDEPVALEQLERLLPGLGPITPLRLHADSPAVGQTLAELGLRGRTGALVLAIVRGEDGIVSPRGGERLADGDTLALFGTAHATEVATALLTGVDPPPGQSSDSWPARVERQCLGVGQRGLVLDRSSVHHLAHGQL